VTSHPFKVLHSSLACEWIPHPKLICSSFSCT